MTDATSSPDRKLRSVRAAPRFGSTRSIMALLLREMSTTYGRSPGGYFWTIGEPVAGIFVMVLIFSAGFRTPALRTNFAIFYPSGFLPFFMFLAVSQKTTGAVAFSRQLLNYPRVTYLDAILSRVLLAVLTQLVVSFLLFSFILLAYETRTTLRLDRLILAYAMAIVFGFGLGVTNCVIGMRYPVWNSVWGVMTRPLVLISGVIFLPDKIPQPYRDWLEWNPVLHVTGEARRAFYYSYQADYVDPVYVFGLGLGLGVLGLLLLRRHYRDLLEL